MLSYADHKSLTGMTITKRKMLLHPELETVYQSLACHVYACVVVVPMLQHCSYISKICAKIFDNFKKHKLPG